MSRQTSNEIEPEISAEQLDEFFRELRRTVLDLEDAYQQGTLGRRLDETDVEIRFGTALARSYRRLSQTSRQIDPEGRRLQTVHDLLREVRDELFQIETWFHTEIVPLGLESSSLEPSEFGPAALLALDQRHEYCVYKNVDQPIRLRLDQILASRSWGIGFVFDDQVSTDRLVAQMTCKALRKFARDLQDLASLLPRILRSQSDRFPNLVPPRFGRAFEQLMTDILNEDSPHAHLSSLCEDYSQKTDIRVKYPDLDRNRGARVQVTLASTLEHYVQKIEGIRNADQFVILSPWSLADAVPQLGMDRSEHYGEELMKQFWACIPGMPSSVEDLSRQLKAMLSDAINAPIRDPRGPMINVPHPVRQFIRCFVHAEAIRSTQALRQREATEGRYRTGHDGRLVVKRQSDHVISQAALDFIQEHPSGAIVRAVVKRLEPDGAWVQLSGELYGRIDRREISWSDSKADPRRFFEVDRESDFLVRRVDVSHSPAIIELSLKRLIPDPWSHETLRTLAAIGVIDGRVVRCASYGLFVEVMKDLVGLLHQSQFPEAIVDRLESVYPIGSLVRVTIDSIDLNTRRMSLSLA